MYTNLKPSGYIPRLADELVERYVSIFGAVEISGTMWCGKSWTASAFAESITRMDKNSSLYSDDPEVALEGAQPHAIDEWQDVPEVWNYVRHRVDDNANRPGQFILTGSSTPPEAKWLHSGAGRFGRIRMHTMTLSETGESSKQVSLQGLFEGEFSTCQSELGLIDLAKIVCRGGWPTLQNHNGMNYNQVVDEYLETFFNISMRKAGKNPDFARKLAASLARNVGTSATIKTLANDIAVEDAQEPADSTISDYLSLFNANYFINELDGWDAPVRSRSRIRTKPKRYFEDPSLAAGLLGVDHNRLLYNQQLFGIMFESLCVHDITVYAGLMKGSLTRPLKYYADADGLEVDIIIELKDGRWAAIEVKLGMSKVEEAASNLLRLQSKIKANPAARNKDPEFLAVVVGKGEFAYRRKNDGVYVIPIDTLTA